MKLTEKELEKKQSWLNGIRKAEKGNLHEKSEDYLEDLDTIYSASREQLDDVYRNRKTIQEMLDSNRKQEDALLDIMNSILNHQEDELFEVNKVSTTVMTSKSTETAATLADLRYDVEMMLYHMIRNSKDLKLFITIDGKQFMATSVAGGVIDFQGTDGHFSSDTISDEKMLSVFKGADELASASYGEKASRYRTKVIEELGDISRLLFESIWNLTPSGKKGASFTVGALPASARRTGSSIELKAGAKEWTLEMGQDVQDIFQIAQVLEEMEDQLQSF